MRGPDVGMNTRRSRAWLAVPVAVALIAASCGDDDDGSSADTTPAAGTTADGTDAPTTSASSGPADTAGDETGTTPAVSGPATTIDRDEGTDDIDPDATLRVATNYPAPATLDPHKVPSPIASMVSLGLLYDRLTHIGSDMSVEPMLATEWEFSADGTTVTFTLRDDATFADGTPVDAAAVKASLERGKTLEGSTAVAALVAIETVTADDPTHVSITTNRPAADLPATLAGIEGSIIDPAHIDDPALETTPAGSGPYVLDQFTPTESVSFTRRDGYWDAAAQQAAAVQIIGMPTDPTRLNALRTGEIDLMMTTLGQYEEVSGLGDGFVTSTYTAASPYTMYFNTGIANLDNPTIRQALNYAIDRDAISDALLGGQCQAINQILTEAYDGHVDAPEQDYTYDPDKARELLGEAGVPDGFSIRVLVPAGLTLYENIATALQAQLADIGVQVELVPQDSTQIFPSWSAGTFDGFVNVRATRPSASATLEAAYLNPARYPGPVPAGFTEAVSESRDPLLSDSELTAALETASGLTNSQAMDLYICAAPALWTASENVVGADTMGWSSFSAFGDLRYVGVAAG
ncbi:MAG: ABC transporter substrate-binding protein [Ilumatobacteraceae bacterium]